MTTEKLLTLALRWRPSSPFIQYLALKPHDTAKGADGAGAGLLVSGLPLGADEAAVHDLFGVFGPVSQVVLHPLKLKAVRNFKPY
ncbi:hypothetical protein TSOC_008863 [Tetrabaena socialis]|uniref:RRM domain-containing protein n=1 Tax=Tetrabaena socialis TaxID=47790 RepID=A0A2J7ZXB9_9CHLO|nr:hypothetical protein TSOC_008863 [Tetrabaena socialis]|eukprot:PNH04898.1 hypothetical protein TSOC_008863 [Tetrabaena socialis]